MPYSDFRHFAQALCDSAGVALPALAADADGIVAFHLTMRGVTVNILQTPEPARPEDVFILVVFGTIPKGQEHEALQVIAEANYTMMGAGAPVFGMNPATGEVVLRQQVSLLHVEARAAFAAIGRLVDLALQWRSDPMLSDKSAGTTFDPSRLA